MENSEKARSALMVVGHLEEMLNGQYPGDFRTIKAAIKKQIPYKLKTQNGDTGICECGVVTEITDEPFYCRYCGQRLCK